LEFQHAHARARDAVNRRWDWESLRRELQSRGEPPIAVRTQAESRAVYLQRPDLGRALQEEDFQALARRRSSPADIAICVSDGLSAAAVDAHFLPLWTQVDAALRAERFSRFPLVLIPFGRVAVSDSVGEALGAKLSLIFIGERPGLTSADSLGIYLTFAPRLKTPDSRRNCLSNIRPPEGLSYEGATARLLYLVRESLRRQLSGVDLKQQRLDTLPGEKKHRLE
jgi:ethanolamine ammonia-lyase small subunit